MKVQLFDEPQLRRLHEASMQILEKVGVHVPHDEALRLFADAGARVDFDNQRVWIPERVVQDCLAKATKEFTLYGRDRTKTAVFAPGHRNYNSSAGQALWVEDLPEPSRRYATLDDVRSAGRLADALPWINMVGAMADPHELPVASRCVAVAAELIKQTTKPVIFWFHDRASAHYLMKLFSIIAGGDEAASAHPIAYPFFEPISPLRFPFRGIDLLFETCKYKLPVPIGPMAQVGATAVATLAGTMAQQNAEVLAGLCIVQLIGPGTPVCYGGIPHAFDMRTTICIFGGPEQALMAVGLTELSRFYGLTSYINVGLSDSKLVDAQAGLEVGMTLCCGAMAGANIFGHLGICGADQGGSLSMLVMQHEIIAYIERLLRGVEITDDTLGVDVLAEGIAAGSFLGLEHTVRHFRRELWSPQLLDRRFWEAWNNDGRQDMSDRCIATKERLLRDHQPQPMAPEMAREVDALVESAKRNLAG